MRPTKRMRKARRSVAVMGGHFLAHRLDGNEPRTALLASPPFV
jgi:hypothetical protein